MKGIHMARRNWKVDADYKFMKNLDSYGWAWEFLRRNREYQQDWKKVLKNYYQCYTFRIAPDIEEDDFSIEPTIIDCRKKWHIASFVNPNTDYPLSLDFVACYGSVFLQSTKVDLKPEQVAVVFDLSLPIKRQVDITAKRLRQWQKLYEKRKIIKVRKPKTQSGLWESYVRTLDAKASKAKNKEIFEVLYSKTRQHPFDKDYHHTVVRDASDAAKELVDGGYRNIVSGG